MGDDRYDRQLQTAILPVGTSTDSFLTLVVPVPARLSIGGAIKTMVANGGGNLGIDRPKRRVIHIVVMSGVPGGVGQTRRVGEEQPGNTQGNRELRVIGLLPDQGIQVRVD